MRRNIHWTGVALVAASGLLLAAELNVGPGTKSTLTATFKQEGVPVENPFTRFSGRITYDAKNVAAATAVIEVDMKSYDIGDPAYNAEVAKASWFDSAAHPKATFRSTAVKAVSATRFDATGTLSVKGRTQTITVPVTVGTAAGATTFDGTFNLSRKAFSIGSPVWDSVLEDAVVVKFHLVGGR